MIFAQMLEIVALSDLASVLCARKFLFDPQGGDLPAAERPQHCVLVGMETTPVVFFEKIIVYMPGKF